MKLTDTHTHKHTLCLPDAGVFRSPPNSRSYTDINECVALSFMHQDMESFTEPHRNKFSSVSLTLSFPHCQRHTQILKGRPQADRDKPKTLPQSLDSCHSSRKRQSFPTCQMLSYMQRTFKSLQVWRYFVYILFIVFQLQGSTFRPARSFQPAQ